MHRYLVLFCAFSYMKIFYNVLFRQWYLLNVLILINIYVYIYIYIHIYNIYTYIFMLGDIC